VPLTVAASRKAKQNGHKNTQCLCYQMWQQDNSGAEKGKRGKKREGDSAGNVSLIYNVLQEETKKYAKKTFSHSFFHFWAALLACRLSTDPNNNNNSNNN